MEREQVAARPLHGAASILTKFPVDFVDSVHSVVRNARCVRYEGVRDRRSVIRCFVELATVVTIVAKTQKVLYLQNRATILLWSQMGPIKRTPPPVSSFLGFSSFFFVGCRSVFPFLFPRIYVFPSAPSLQAKLDLVLCRKKCRTL